MAEIATTRRHVIRADFSGDSNAEDFTFFQAETLDLEFIASSNWESRVPMPTGGSCRMEAWLASDTSTLYVNKAGTTSIDTDKAEVSLSRAESNMPAGTYSYVVKVFDADDTMTGVIASGEFIVKYSPDSDNVDYVGTTTYPVASDITYSNTTSGLTATDVQAAIDELEDEIDIALVTDWGGITGTLSDQTDLQTALDTARKYKVESASFTALPEYLHIVVATATVTDFTPPVEGQGYTVLVWNGTATVGGVAYATKGTAIKRRYHSGSWSQKVYLDQEQVGSAVQTALNLKENAGVAAGLLNDWEVWDGIADIVTDDGKYLYLPNVAAFSPIELPDDLTTGVQIVNLSYLNQIFSGSASGAVEVEPGSSARFTVSAGGALVEVLNFTRPIPDVVQTALDLKADDDAVVHLAGTEDVSGLKKFALGIWSPIVRALNATGLVFQDSAGTEKLKVGADTGADVQVTGDMSVTEKQATAYQNTDKRIATMTGAETLTVTSALLQFLNPDSVARTLDLPNGTMFTIKNTGTGGESITVRDASDVAITDGVIENGVTLTFIDATGSGDWQVIG